jgi:phenylpropionate dioxygenase-like ring-hydroxylating dioxygenase large terminal subunit
MEQVAANATGDRLAILYPRYEAAAEGFRNYWYPVTWSRSIGRRPAAVQLLGQPVMFRREQGKVYAFYNQCPHRGIPLSVGRQDFPGTWSCRYHGWTFDLETGVLKAALTDGPDSPICGKVRARTYPVEERAGLVWVWMGEGAPTVPVEADIPDEFLHPDTVVVGRITVRQGNWRYAAENGFDSSHAKYLHRYGIIRTFFQPAPSWTHIRIESTNDGAGITRPIVSSGREGDFPGLGHWPKQRFWHMKPKRRGGGTDKHSIRLPGIYSSHYASGFAHFEWYVPVDERHHRYLQFHVTQASGPSEWEFRGRYWLYRRWINHIQFNNQDLWMIRLMPESPPERLFRPDLSITAWRKLCEHARGEAPMDTTLDEQLLAEQAVEQRA